MGKMAEAGGTDKGEMMRRVLYVNHSADLDGATQVLVNLIGTLNSGEVEPLVLLPRHGPITRRFDAANIPYRIITVGHCRWDMYHVPMLQMLLREEKIDVVHANTLESYPAIVAARLCNIPVIWHIHEMISHVQYYAHAFRYVDNKIFGDLVSACALICTASEASRDAFVGYCGRLGIDASGKVRAVHNGVRLPDAPVSSRKPERFHITGIGNMVGVKGWEYLIEAYSRVLGDHPNVELTIVGKVFPGYFHVIYGVAEKCGVADRVRFLTETDDIDKVYRESDIIVCSSLVETFPMVVLEAMSYAKPVVATNVGGIGEMLTDRQTGILVPSGNAAALAEGIKYYLDSWDKSIEMGRRAQETVRNRFSLAAQAEEFEDIYRNISQPENFSVPDSEIWTLEEIRELFYSHMTRESEKIFRLEEHFEDMLNQRQYYLEDRDEQHLKHLHEILNQNARERANLVRDLRALENVVNNLLNQWFFRLMRNIKRIFKNK